MADTHDLLKCPLCEGHGEISRARLLELVEQRQIQPMVDSSLASSPSDHREPVGETAAVNPRNRNFREDVHSWNPKLPMWRRSPKE